MSVEGLIKLRHRNKEISSHPKSQFTMQLSICICVCVSERARMGARCPCSRKHFPSQYICALYLPLEIILCACNYLCSKSGRRAKPKQHLIVYAGNRIIRVLVVFQSCVTKNGQKEREIVLIQWLKINHLQCTYEI